MLPTWCTGLYLRVFEVCLIFMFDFTMEDVHGLPRKLRMSSGCDIFASSSTLETDIGHFHGQKIGPDEMECNDGETTIVNPILCTDIHGGRGLVWLISW